MLLIILIAGQIVQIVSTRLITGGRYGIGLSRTEFTKYERIVKICHGSIVPESVTRQISNLVD